MGVEALNLGSRVLDPTDLYPLPLHLISTVITTAPRPPSPLSDLHVSPLLLSPNPPHRAGTSRSLQYLQTTIREKALTGL